MCVDFILESSITYVTFIELKLKLFLIKKNKKYLILSIFEIKLQEPYKDGKSLKAFLCKVDRLKLSFDNASYE